MSLPARFLDQLRERLPLSAVVGRRLRLVRAGREYKAPCPFHHEKTPSFFINDAKGFYHCFGCGAHGDVIRFVMQYDHLSFIEAVALLAGQAGMTVPRPAEGDHAPADRSRALVQVLEWANGWFRRQLTLPGAQAARDTLERRGLTAEIGEAFQLGYAPTFGNLLFQEARQAGIEPALLLEVGLVAESTTGPGLYSFFRDRLIFPIHDRRGQTIAFGGRRLRGDGPKYLNTRESPLFSKGHVLYNGHRARAAAARGGDLFIVEGYLDVIALSQFGFPRAVAPLGTALTAHQLTQAWQLIPPPPEGVRAPVLCFDGDGAGRRAAVRAAELALSVIAPDRSVRVAFLPEGEDPDSLLRQPGGREPFHRLAAESQPLVDFLWQAATAGRELRTPEQRALLRRQLLETVSAIADRPLQQLYRHELLGRWAALGRPGGESRVPRPPPSAAPAAARPDAVLVAILLHHPEYWPEYWDELGEADVGGDGEAAAVWRHLGRLIGGHGRVDAATLRADLAAAEPGMPRVLATLDHLYRTHVTGGDRDPAHRAAHVAAVVADVLRLKQVERLLRERAAAYQRQHQGTAEERRIEALTAEIDRLHEEQNEPLFP